MTFPRVYFYCCDEPGNLQEDVIALAEGLRALGIPYFANCDYWQQSTDPGDYLFKRDHRVSHHDCDVVVVTYTWPLWVRMGDFKARHQLLPEGLFKPGRGYATVFMDNYDGYRTVSWGEEYRRFDLILRSKFNKRAFHPSNMRPWAYGLTNRIINAAANSLPFEERVPALLVNFGASHHFNYSVREISHKRLEPKLRHVIPIDYTKDDLSEEPVDPYAALMWRQTGGRFSQSYYDRLKRTQAMVSFCGDIIPPAPWRPEAYLVGGNRAALRRLAFGLLGRLDRRAPRAVGCDSFRFWEGLAAGCAIINVDLEYYGVELPVMPVNRVHYLGLNFGKINAFVERLVDEPELFEKVGAAGRSWAATHYSPKAVAQRFISMFSTEAVGNHNRAKSNISALDYEIFSGRTGAYRFYKLRSTARA